MRKITFGLCASVCVSAIGLSFLAGELSSERDRRNSLEKESKINCKRMYEKGYSQGLNDARDRDIIVSARRDGEELVLTPQVGKEYNLNKSEYFINHWGQDGIILPPPPATMPKTSTQPSVQNIPKFEWKDLLLPRPAPEPSPEPYLHEGQYYVRR